ncbi:MAG TPA: carbamoyltransferase [Thermoanaerobaculia bacterium]|nr:carbamoyltransferase [Thermoanaerobaculia bacterium]
MMKLLGISCYYHDSAACLVDEGRIVAAAQEERFTRKKHDEGFPTNAVRYCLAEGGVRPGELDGVVFYDKPLLKFHRILETYLATAPKGLRSAVMALPVWLREKLWIPPQIQEALELCGVGEAKEIFFTEHHESHAASAFYPSPFEEAAVLTLDGVGEWATTTIGVGEGNRLRLIRELTFPHSLGLLYSAFTYFTGFRVNSGEYKLMGLAPYGEGKYADLIKRELVDVREDGSFRMNMDYFGYLDGLAMTNGRFAALFGGPARPPESPITQREMDIAKSIQDVTEEIVLKLARHAREITGKRHLCMAGGVALNCVANGVLLRAGIFDDIWIQPAAGDAGGALGAPLAVWHNAMDKPRTVSLSAAGKPRDAMRGSLLGPEFTREQTREFLDFHGYPYEELSDADWARRIAEVIAGENVIGLCQGRMEFGPRALGGRSIIGDARSPKMQSVMNLKIKYRESFRPFAPSVLEERVSDYFDLDRPSPYMLLVADVVESRRVPKRGDERDLPLTEWVNRPRSDVPAITHVDYSARIQTVGEESPRYHAIIQEFEKLTGYGVIVNTSFNVRGEPIVCTPEDAYRCFMRTEMDYLVLGPFLLDKKAQPEIEEKGDWRQEFQLD